MNKNSLKHNQNLVAFGFNIPAVVLFVLFFFVPVVLTFVISATDMSSSTGFKYWRWVGMENYINILRNPRALDRMLLTVKYTIVTLAFFNVGLAFIIALITTSIHRKAGSFFRALWLLPRITPTVVYVMMWSFLLADEPYGILNQLLAPLGVEPKYWVAELPFLSIVLVNGYIGASFGMIIFTSAIESIPVDLIRASMVDGAGFLQRVRYIILPHLKWSFLFVITYQTLSLLTSFEQILILTDGAYNTEVWALWSYHRALNNYWGNFQWGYGSALAGMLVVVGVILAFIYMKFFKFKELIQEPKIDEL